MTQEHPITPPPELVRELQIKSDRLLKHVSAIIAHPHTTITVHDKHRALEIIRCLYSDQDVIEHLYSQMNQEDFKAVKEIRSHAFTFIKEQ